jgi:hypothetical protein
MRRMSPEDLLAWKYQTPSDVYNETVRARAEEARLTEEVARRDIEITKLREELAKTGWLP